MLPSATEMVCALGLENELVGISHECDYPPEVRSKPQVVRAVIDTIHMTPLEIDNAISEKIRQGQSIYEVNAEVLRTVAPDLILTQSLCDVCAPSGNEATQALASLPYPPQVLYLTPHSLSDIWDNLLEIGRAIGREAAAHQKIKEYGERLERVAAITRTLPTVRMTFLEWLDPPFNAGHWVPEMARIAGGHDPLGNEGKDSFRVGWDAIVNAQPDILLISPCGYHTADAVQQIGLLKNRNGWNSIPAVQKKQVYALDASSYFARPGPRVVEGVELLAHLFHPAHFSWSGPADAFHRLD